MNTLQLQSSSAVAFARSLFHAGEAKELFHQQFVFASAVSTYYGMFHLSEALILAYCCCYQDKMDNGMRVPAEDPHSSIRKALEEGWRKRRRIRLPHPVRIGKTCFSDAFPDPAEEIGHKDVPGFLRRELPEVFESLGCRGQRGTLYDMREFVSYAPRVVSNGRIPVLYSGCHYEAQDFKNLLKRHLGRVDGFFASSARWMKQKGYNALYSRILSGDFILFEFTELGSYHPESVVKGTWVIYRSLCESEGTDWRIWRGDPNTWYADEQERRERYAEAIRHFES